MTPSSCKFVERPSVLYIEKDLYSLQLPDVAKQVVA